MDLKTSHSLTFRRKILAVIGAKINITDTASGQNVGFIQQKGWKLKEDVRIYSDETKTHELMVIKARSVIDLGATYDIYDSSDQTIIGSMKREGISSTFIRDAWKVSDSSGNPYVSVEETGSLALIRRYVGLIPIAGGIVELIFMFQPQVYAITYTGDGQNAVIATITRQKNPIVTKFVTNVTIPDAKIDYRIIAGIGAMLCVIDGNKN